LVSTVVVEVHGMRPGLLAWEQGSYVEDIPLLECPQHLIPTVIAKIERESCVEDIPLDWLVVTTTRE